MESAVLGDKRTSKLSDEIVELDFNSQRYGYKTQCKGLCANLIINELVIKENLKIIDGNKKWILDELSKPSIMVTHNIPLVFADNFGKITVHKKAKTLKLSLLFNFINKKESVLIGVIFMIHYVGDFSDFSASDLVL